MTPEECPQETPAREIKYSVGNRVLVTLTLIILSFTLLLVYNVYLYRNSVTELDLITNTYMPLALGTREIESTQLVFNTLMDRLADEPGHPLTRDWIDAARRYRPVTLSRLIVTIGDQLDKGNTLPEEDRVFLMETRERLRDVRRRYRLNENRFIQLFTFIEMGKTDDTTEQIEKLKRSERLLNNVLSGIGNDVQRYMQRTSQEAVNKGTTATILLAILNSILLLISIGIIISTRNLLKPLKILYRAVSKVAAGELDTHIDIKRNDEIGALADNFNRMTDALFERDKRLIRQERLATAGRIAAQVTHEIRNPLSSLDLNADLLADEIGPNGSPKEAQQLLLAMRDEIERLTNITEAYLRFARLPAPILGTHDINGIIRDSVRFMTPELQDHRITCQTVLENKLTPIMVDKEQFRQIMVNLLKNAIQASPEGSDIIIATGNGDAGIEMTVEDNGPGIETNMASHIFDPFYTTKTTGTGLGLAIVRQICLAHNGTINYRTKDEGGAHFTVRLPHKQPKG